MDIYSQSDSVLSFLHIYFLVIITQLMYREWTVEDPET